MFARALTTLSRVGSRFASASAAAPSATGPRRAWMALGAVLGVGAGVVYLYTDSPSAGKKVVNILISGPPGSGKGTQSANLVRDYKLVHISTGDMLRDEVKAKSPLGLKAKSFMDQGLLVPEEVFFDILKARLSQPDVKERGWLLDGFPRNRAQVELMNKNGLIPDKFLLLMVDDDVAVARMSGRRTDPVTGKIYHMVFNPPPADPEIRGRLVHRSDDSEEKAKVRLAGYHKNMDDAVNWYPASKLVVVDAAKSEEEVYKDIKKALDPLFK